MNGIEKKLPGKPVSSVDFVRHFCNAMKWKENNLTYHNLTTQVVIQIPEFVEVRIIDFNRAEVIQNLIKKTLISNIIEQLNSPRAQECGENHIALPFFSSKH